MKKLVCDVSDEKHKELKIEAAQRGITLRELIARKLETGTAAE